MKKVIAFFSILVLICISTASFAQAKKSTIKVAGECGMCQKKIETAARNAGATFASWSTDTKILTVRYNASTTNTTKIEQAVAAVGYDTQSVKGNDEAYSKLHACCKYERAGQSSESCCASDKCKETACMKNGKCAPDMSCCREGDCAKKDCCKKS